MVSKTPEAFRNITEVSTMLNVPTHVLRFWETRFTQLKPNKRNGGRRYYRPEDIILLKRIQELLYEQGYTIKGAQQVLKNYTKPKENEAVAVLSVANSLAQKSTVSNNTDRSEVNDITNVQASHKIDKAISILKEAKSRLNQIR